MTRPFRLTSLPTPSPASPNTLRGQNAQRAGSAFEKIILWSAGIHKTVVALHRLPAFGAKHVGGGRTVFTPIVCDFIGAIIDVCGLFCDGKSTDDPTSLNAKTFIFAKRHQYDFLLLMGEAGQCAGYLVEAKAIAKYLWLPVEEITDDGPIRFCRDGKLCRHWTDLGSTAGAVDFPKLKEVYK